MRISSHLLRGIAALLLAMLLRPAQAQRSFCLDSKISHNGKQEWLTLPQSELKEKPETMSLPGFSTEGWLPAIVHGAEHRRI